MIGNRTINLGSVAKVIVLIAILTMVSRPAYATTGLITCTATLAGSNEVPPHITEGTGIGTFTFDESTSTTTWSVTFSGLSAPATAAHIHSPAGTGVNAPVVVPLAPGFPVATSGTFSLSSTALIGRTAALFAGDLLAGNAYVNIHTSTFPGGEIRGQLSCSEAPRPVPEFGSLVSILAISLVALMAMRASLFRRP